MVILATRVGPVIFPLVALPLVIFPPIVALVLAIIFCLSGLLIFCAFTENLNLLYQILILFSVFFLVPYDNLLNSIRYSTIVMSVSNVIHLGTFTASPRCIFLTYVTKWNRRQRSATRPTRTIMMHRRSRPWHLH